LPSNGNKNTLKTGAARNEEHGTIPPAKEAHHWAV